MHVSKFFFRVATLMVAWGVMGAEAAAVKFDLPAQAASSALASFAKQAEVEVLFSFDELKAVTTAPVIGSYEPDAALALLLRGTGFIGTQTAARKFIVERPVQRSGGEIRGRVVKQGTGEPLAGATVRVVGHAILAHSEGDGAFRLSEVPIDTPGIVVQADGCVTLQVFNLGLAGGRTTDLGAVRMMASGDPQQMDKLVINANDLASAGFPLFALQRVVVTPSRFGLDQERGSLAATLTEAELQALPQLGEDLYRAISRLPGLAADDFTARFWVRGAPHDKVLARLDGVDLIEPFHMKDTDSSLAIVDLESINRVALFTGGFTAEFGDRLAGVLTMETDSPARARPRTSLGLSLTGARIGSRGQTTDGRSRWLVSARTGMPDIALENNDGEELKLRYYDVTGKWEYDIAPGHTLSWHVLHAGDTGDYTVDGAKVLTSRYDSDYVWGRWQGSFGQRLKGEAVASFADLSWRRNGTGMISGRFPASVDDARDLRVFELRQDWTLGGWERVLLRGGADFKTGAADYRYRGSRDVDVVRNGVLERERRSRASDADPAGTSTGVYASVRAQPWAALTVEPGLRYDRNDYAGDSDVSPRVSAAWTIGPSTLRAAWGLYHQAQGLHELASRDGDTTFRPSERAEHRVLSFEHRLPGRINLRLEGYERIVTRPRVRWENTIRNIAVFPEWTNDRAQFDPVRQHARGVELVAERRIGETWSWSGSYAWSKAEETLRNGTTLPRARDQRHALYLDVSYAPNPRWQFSASWQSHTGWPTTELNFTPVVLGNGQTILTTQSAPIFASRLPSYQRLDVRAQRRFEFKRSTLRLYVDVFNVLARDNVIEYDYNVRLVNGQVMRTRVPDETQLQRLITGGLTWDF